MDINEIYLTCQYIINKEINGAFSPDSFRLMYPTAEDDFFRSIARPAADQFHSWSVLKAAEDDLRLHTLKVTTTLNFVSGLANLPADFRDWLAFGLNITLTDNCDKPYAAELLIEVVASDEWPSRFNASIRKPSLAYPIIKFNATQLQIAPITATPVSFTYYKIPVKPVWANIVPIVNDTPVYDPNTSVQSEYPEITHIQILNILLKKVGINLSFSELERFATEAKAQV